MRVVDTWKISWSVCGLSLSSVWCLDKKSWTVEELICAIEWFIRSGSITETQRTFRREITRRDASSHIFICR